MKNKEIEELLNKLRKCPLDDEYALKYKSIDLDLSNVKLLLSYIEQLENNRDKAIEYIEKYKYYTHSINVDELINILKGDKVE